MTEYPKPRIIYVDPCVASFDDPDQLSRDLVIFAAGGTVDGRPAIPFVELTPEVLQLLREHWPRTERPHQEL
jgi:hypothetical protein